MIVCINWRESGLKLTRLKKRQSPRPATRRYAIFLLSSNVSRFTRDLMSSSWKFIFIQTQSSHNQTAPHLRGEYANYGEFLYIEGLANMEHRRQKAQHVTQEQQEQELFGATFQPEILEKSRSMRAHVHVPVWQRLGRHSCTTSAAKRRAIYQADRERENLTECTFKPKVSPFWQPCASKPGTHPLISADSNTRLLCQHASCKLLQALPCSIVVGNSAETEATDTRGS